ncbi:acyl-CoA dehydrogenase NM domain-like protein [Mycena rebaudengoi]|nr:acyl-CoA dehydrogenase NM domain-like protein [Mycena rebaudengoi]
MRVEDVFHQPPPPAGNPYLCDPVLPSLLKRLLPSSALSEIEPDLIRLGHDLVHVIRPLAPQVEPAVLTQYDAWGNRIDELRVSEGWKTLKAFACREGCVRIAYERKYREHSRIYMFAKTMLIVGDTHVIMCPYGMTDGAARVVELSGSDKMKKEILPRLISSDPDTAYISGQWMTESSGGSDVSRTETVATPTDSQAGDLGPAYVLDGFKWFSSAAEGNMAVALARTGSPNGGTGTLSLFLVPVRLPPFPTPLSNKINIHRLKDKFGTRAVPTAELSLNGTRAWRMGAANEGIRLITPVLNITRIHSSIHSIGSLMRALAIARAYASVRAVDGGKLLQTIPGHMETLASVNLLYRALTHLVFGTIALLGRTECGVATPEEEGRLRLLTPTVKAFAALKTVPAIEECMAALGGQGYMEETGIARLIRDALVEKIWEGTVDVLAHDLIRASRAKGIVDSFCQWAQTILSSATQTSSAVADLRRLISDLPTLFRKTHNPFLARPLLTLFAQIASAVFLLEHAVWAHQSHEPSASTDWAVFERWVNEGGMKSTAQDIAGLEHGVEERIKVNQKMVGELDPRAKL